VHPLREEDAEMPEPTLPAPAGRTWGRRLLLGLLTAGVGVLALEAFSGVALRASEGRWIGPAELAAARTATARGERGDTLLRVIQQVEPIEDERVLHPYLGYVMDPRLARPGVGLAGLNRLAIELGFPRNTRSVLQPADPSHLVVGLFGGSVADILSASGAEALAAELAKAPGFGQREIVIVSAAAPGYKQPQALMALNYLLLLGAHFDFVVNLDGVNELSLPATELTPLGVAPHYPRGWYTRTSNLDPERSLALGRTMMLEQLRRRSARLFSRVPLRLSLTAGLVWLVGDRALTSFMADAERSLGNRPEGYDPQAQGPLLGRGASERVKATRVWSRSSIQMARLCEGFGIRYAHFLQPNQYVPDSKPLGEEERRIAYRPDSPIRAPIERGYPALREAGESLRAEGVTFVDLSEVFRDVEQPVYADDCCHLNQEGNKQLGAAIGRALAAGVTATDGRSEARSARATRRAPRSGADTPGSALAPPPR